MIALPAGTLYVSGIGRLFASLEEWLAVIDMPPVAQREFLQANFSFADRGPLSDGTWLEAVARSVAEREARPRP